MTVVPYIPAYRQAVEHICLETSGTLASAKEKDKRFILSLYCRYYLDHGLCYTLLDDGGQPVGYILCAPDFAQYARDFAPYLADIKKCGFIKGIIAKAELDACRKYSAQYPAHLHIDILEPFTGGGNGTALMQTLLEHLRREKVPGIMLMVSAKNTRAIRFYEKMGFVRLEENPSAITMGQKL